MSYRPFLYFGIAGLMLLCFIFLYQSQKNIDNSVFTEERVAIPFLQAPERTTILVFGDVMLDRSVRKYINEHGTAALFEYVQKDIDAAHITLINLEGPITTYESVVSKENLQFTFATHTALDLSTVGIDIVSLANNHTNNFGLSGLQQTRVNLDNSQISYFGDPSNLESRLALNLKKEKLSISFIGYNQFENPKFTSIQDKIREEKQKGNFVILYPHWGIEYEKKAGGKEREIAQSAIIAGADMVIGAHPHVVQDMEMYNGKPIFYSLGNFIFDQWFTSDVQEGLALLVTLSDDTLVSIELKPFIRERYQPHWLEGEERIHWCNTYTEGGSLQKENGDPCVLSVKEV